VIAYEIARFLLTPLFRIVWRARVRGAHNVPRSGPLIVACNHVSYLDPPVLGTFCPRSLRYMAKEELFDFAVLGPLIRAVGAYPVDREGSATAAIKRSVDVLREGEAIGIFPEGTRNLTGEVAPRPGVALLASLAKAPVVPACIVYSGKGIPKIKVAFGPPLSLPSDRKATRDDLAKFTESIMNEIRSLSEQP
jgi:1-acyl-sn-glycerol-3-phosphate acyltransferase